MYRVFINKSLKCYFLSFDFISSGKDDTLQLYNMRVASLNFKLIKDQIFFSE